jgi:hypothetical protein
MQAQAGVGRTFIRCNFNDYTNTTPFNIEVKSGKSHTLPKWVWDALKQCRDAGDKTNMNLIVIQGYHKEPIFLFGKKDFIRFMDDYF